MDFLKKFLLIFSLLAAGAAWASSEDSVESEGDLRARILQEQERLLCHATDEYVATLKFLRANKELVYPENTSRMIAEKVARGCDGASERFAKVLLLLKSVGLSERGALEMALKFSAEPPDVQKNFSEIFSRAFLAEFFDYDYQTAAHLAFELSRDYHSDPAQVREDFLELVRYCKDHKTLDLPASGCAEITVKFARLTQYFPGGIRQPFYKLFTELREKKEFALNVKSALEITYKVLKNGPRAPENFLSAYTYATSKDGLALTQIDATSFALRMSERSFVGGEHPPVVPPLVLSPELKHAANP